MEAVTDPLSAAGAVELPLPSGAPAEGAPDTPRGTFPDTPPRSIAASGSLASTARFALRRRFALDDAGRLALKDAIGVLLSSRALVWIAAVTVILLFGFGPSRGAYHPPGLTAGFGPLGNVLAAPAARWDGAWYLTIARYGYLPDLGPFTAARSAFFPLYPLLTWLVSLVGVAGALAGVIVSLSALLAALYALHRLMTLELASPASRLWGAMTSSMPRPSISMSRPSSVDVARLALLLTAFGPMAFFLSADYSESLYLALSIGVFLQARRGRWVWAGVLGGLAAATRSTGVLLILPAAILYLYGPREDVGDGVSGEVPDGVSGNVLGGVSGNVLGGVSGDVLGGVSGEALSGVPSNASGMRWRRSGALERLRPRYPLRLDALPLLLIPIGLLSYIVWFWLAGGEPLTPLHAQALWGRHFSGPFIAAWEGLNAAFEGARQLLSGQSRHLYFPLEGHSAFIEAGHNMMLFAFLALALPMVIGVLRRLPIAYGAYVVSALALPLSYPVRTQPLMSLPRFLLVLFPLTMWLAAWLARRRRVAYVLLGVSALALAFFTAEFSTWHWVA